jgi:hypothetical protein
MIRSSLEAPWASFLASCDESAMSRAVLTKRGNDSYLDVQKAWKYKASSVVRPESAEVTECEL